MTNQAHKIIVAALGFAPVIDVRGRLSVADLFANSKTRTGVYLLEFASRTYYVGQAVEVCRRFVQHCSNVGDIVGFAFIPAKISELDDIERNLIRSAETAGLPITNRVHVSNVLGVTDFDLVVPPIEQEPWLGSWPRIAPQSNAHVAIPANAPARTRTAQAFGRLHAHPKWKEVRLCLQTYCAGCLPFPSKTQLTFWSVSCLPSTNKSTWPRFSAVNAGLMEMLVIGWEAGDSATWGFVNGARSVIEREYGSVRSFERKHKRFAVDEERQYRSAGSDQLRFSAGSIGDLTELLVVPAVRDSAAQLALRVMRSRPTIYSKFHCPALADAMLGSLAS